MSKEKKDDESLLDHKTKWYYDSNALDSESGVYREIINLKDYSTVAVTSHLALGEALGNTLKKGEEKFNAFVELIRTLKDVLLVLGHDDINGLFQDVRACYTALSITDSIHLATAIKEQCTQFKTSDNDFLGLKDEGLKQFAMKHGCETFCCKDVRDYKAKRR